MNVTQINAKIYAGRGKAAQRIGMDYDVFRPIGAGNPLANQITTIKAAFNAGDSSYKSPNMPGDAFWYGDFDGRVTQAGDYLVHNAAPNDIKFVMAQQSLLPIIVVECNRTIRISRTSSQSGVGDVGYSGACDHVDADVLGAGAGNVMWPASVLFGRGSGASTGLPSSVPQAGWRILLPPSVPVVIKNADILTDDLGKRYIVQAAEQSDTGWRINAIEVHS
jgi:hypothetical protein